MMWKTSIVIGAAGACGALCRWWLGEILARRFGETFPVGTLVINLAGCFLAGLFFYLLEERFAVSELWRVGLFVGFLGAFTTFSAYGLQTFSLIRAGEIFNAALYVAVSNIVGLLLVAAGYFLAQALFK